VILSDRFKNQFLYAIRKTTANPQRIQVSGRNFQMNEQHVQSKVSLWIQAARPKTLPAALAPVAVGSAVAFRDKGFGFFTAMVCLACAVTLQVAVNFANDYFDAKNKIDSEDRLGPVRVTQSGLIPAKSVKRAIICSLGLTVFFFFYLVSKGGVVIFFIGIASILAALAYSGGPFPLASHGLGELFVFIFFGVVAVCGTYFIQVGQVNRFIFFSAVPPGLLITAIMVVNNHRDRETDRKAGKNTLAVMLGKRLTIVLYTFLVVLSYLMPVVMIAGDSRVSAMIFLSWLTLPHGWKLICEVREKQGSDLNETLAKTAKLSLVFSLLFAVGIIWPVAG
jgi:1,4-dihydroxy-2-naphthoate octaprenyltransferase